VTLILTEAVSRSNKHLVQLFLDKGSSDIGASTPDSEFTLYAAVTNSDEHLIRLLLQYDAKTTSKPFGSDSMLHVAALRGYMEIVRVLLESEDINIDATSPRRYTTALQEAAGKENPILRRIFSKGEPLLMQSPWELRLPQTVRTLLRYGADPGAKTWLSKAALYNAVCNGNVALAKLLLAYGAATVLKVADANNVLWTVAEKCDLILTNLLIEYGANVDSAPWNRISALWHAARRGDSQMARLLLQSGADPNKKLGSNNSALWYATSEMTPRWFSCCLIMVLTTRRMPGDSGHH